MPRTKIGDPRTLLGELARWVIIETPTSEAARVNALMDFAVGGLAEAGVALTRIPGRDGYGDNSIARVNERPGVKPILVVGHLDTVWSTGTLATMPFRVDGDRAYGPGILDMAHQPDEYVVIEDMVNSAKVMALAARALLLGGG